MNQHNEKQSSVQPQHGVQPSSGSRPQSSEAKAGEGKKEKDAGESYLDYNGNSEANSPARARE